MNHFQRYLAEEAAEDFQEGRLTRRQALKLIASITGSLVMAEGILAACAPAPEDATVQPVAGTPTPAPAATTAAPPTQPVPGTPAATSTPASPSPSDTAAPAASDTPAATTGAGGSPTAHPVGTVLPDDPAVVANPVEFPGGAGTLLGYLARPAATGASPVVLVCHENRGLTPHIEDVTRRLAKAGYLGLAVDLLSRSGGSAAVGTDQAPGLLSALSPDDYVADFRSGWEYTATLPEALPEQLGMVGFCFGGGVTWQVATRLHELRAAVPFYGPHPLPEDVPGIQAAVLAIYGELDQRINSGIPAIEAAMQANGKLYEKVIYPGADHAFHNDTGSRYNSAAAQDAWSRALGWFAQHLQPA
jgi:carboxymethylenebutenolidase